MPGRSRYGALILAVLLITGCARSGPADAVREYGIDPAAPVAAGHAALPLPGEPTPLGSRSLSGLYASPPAADTLEALSTAPVSPDGLFRAVLRDGEIWVTRIDGAWLWQVTLPPATPAPPEGGADGGAQGTAQPDLDGNPAGQGAATPPGADPAGASTAADSPANPPESPAIEVEPVAPLTWTPRSTLLLRDTASRWLEADPATAAVTPLGPFLTGATHLIPSPDGSQVLFYKGNQLYTARWDGSDPQPIGENLVGHWDSAGQLVVRERPADTENPD